MVLVGKNLPASAGDTGHSGSIPGSGRSPGERNWQPTPVFLPGKSHGQRSLVGYSPWGCKESDSGECLSAHVCACTHTRTQTQTHSDTLTHSLSIYLSRREDYTGMWIPGWEVIGSHFETPCIVLLYKNEERRKYAKNINFLILFRTL